MAEVGREGLADARARRRVARHAHQLLERLDRTPDLPYKDKARKRRWSAHNGVTVAHLINIIHYVVAAGMENALYRAHLSRVERLPDRHHEQRHRRRHLLIRACCEEVFDGGRCQEFARVALLAEALEAQREPDLCIAVCG